MIYMSKVKFHGAVWLDPFGTLDKLLTLIVLLFPNAHNTAQAKNKTKTKQNKIKTLTS